MPAVRIYTSRMRSSYMYRPPGNVIEITESGMGCNNRVSRVSVSSTSSCFRIKHSKMLHVQKPEEGQSIFSKLGYVNPRRRNAVSQWSAFKLLRKLTRNLEGRQVSRDRVVIKLPPQYIAKSLAAQHHSVTIYAILPVYSAPRPLSTTKHLPNHAFKPTGETAHCSCSFLQSNVHAVSIGVQLSVDPHTRLHSERYIDGENTVV